MTGFYGLADKHSITRTLKAHVVLFFKWSVMKCCAELPLTRDW